MKVLIIGVGRSGTTSLYKSFKEQNFFGIGEPFNYGIKRKFEYNYPLRDLETKENVIVKFLIFQKPKYWKGSWDSFLLEFASKFDKIILLDRKNFNEHLMSITNLWYKVSISGSLWQTWTEEEIPLKFKEEYRIRETGKLKQAKSEMLKLSETLGVDIIWYENLYSSNRDISKKIIESWEIPNIDVDKMNSYLNPKYKLKKIKSII